MKLDCPDSVDGGEGATFSCDVTGPRGKSELTMKIVKQNGELKVDFADDGDARAALEKAGEP